MQTYKPDTLVKCEWEDAWAGISWRPRADIIHEPMKVTTVGYVVKHDKTGLTLSATKDENGNYGGTCFRPAKMIVKIKVLERAAK